MAAVQIGKNKKTFGKFRINEIIPEDIRELQRELAKIRTTNTTNQYIHHLSHVFNAAIKDEIIKKNPAQVVDPLRRTEQPARETKHRALTEQETDAFFNAAVDRKSAYLNHYKMLILTGLRIGELGAITEFDISEKEGVLRVNRTITRDVDGHFITGNSTKTQSGKREIPLNKNIVATVKAQKRVNKILFDKSPKTLFCSPNGRMLNPVSVNYEIKQICNHAGIDPFTCHAFRATFATRFIERRPEDYKTLQEILGHSNVGITLNLYTHVMQEKKVKAMEAVEDII